MVTPRRVVGAHGNPEVTLDGDPEVTQGASGGPRVIYRHLETAGDRNVRYLTRGRAHGVALQVCVMCDDAKGCQGIVAAAVASAGSLAGGPRTPPGKRRWGAHPPREIWGCVHLERIRLWS